MSPTFNMPIKVVAAISTTPLKPAQSSGTKSPAAAKGKKKGKKKGTKPAAPKPEKDEMEPPKPRKPSPTPKEREIVTRIEKMAIIDLDVQREFDAMRKGVMQWSKTKQDQAVKFQET